MDCQHTVTQGRDGETGSWCCACGVKVYAVETRECKDCAHHRRLIDGSVCRRHLMAVTPSMNVTYRIAEGSCFEAAPSSEPPAPTAQSQAGDSATALPGAREEAPSGAILTAGQILAMERRSNMTDDEALRFGRAIEALVVQVLATSAPESATSAASGGESGAGDWVGNDWCIVPAEPTPEMRRAGYLKLTQRIESDDSDMGAAYRAMLAAAPKP